MALFLVYFSDIGQIGRKPDSETFTKLGKFDVGKIKIAI
jgi:hypothetical protein